MALDAILKITEAEELAKKSVQEAAVQAKDLLRQAPRPRRPVRRSSARRRDACPTRPLSSCKGS